MSILKDWFVIRFAMAVAKEKINPQKPPRLARKSSKLNVDLP